RLVQPSFSNIRRLASSLQAPSSSFYVPSVRRAGSGRRSSVSARPLSKKDMRNMIEDELYDRGLMHPDKAYPSLEELGLADEKELSPTQQRMETLQERLEKSGHEVPQPKDQGRQGFVGGLLNALGAPGGAVTTLLHDIADGGDFNPWQSIKSGWTGDDRKTGSDILEE